ncbi:hypothetical protein ES703_120843 [subsurface metagenome]
MAHARLTMLDIAKMNGSDALVGLIDEIAGIYPEWDGGFARTIKGTQYKTLVRTALPTVGFRNANEGVETTKSTRVQRLVECFILDASWDVDAAVADANDDGPEAACALEALDHFEGGVKTACSQLYYGTSADDKGFSGFITNVDSTMVVDATGTTASTGSRVWGVKWGIRDVAWVAGRNGRMAEGDILRTCST